MSITSIGSSSYSMGQMTAMWRQSASSGMSAQKSSDAGPGAPPDPGEIFSNLDNDSSGGLSQTEFQTLADKISEATGEDLDVEELFATYDEDEDGVLSETEAQAVMDDYRPEGPPPPPPEGMMDGMPGGPPPDLFGEADEDEDGAIDETEAQTLVDFINQATGEELDVGEFLASYDEDGDGVLSEAETQAAMEAYRPEDPQSAASESTAQAADFSSEITAAIENYAKMAALGQPAQMMAMLSGSDANSAEALFSINTSA